MLKYKLQWLCRMQKAFILTDCKKHQDFEVAFNRVRPGTGAREQL